MDAILEVLKADQPGGHAITVSWNEYTSELFRKRAETARVVDQEQHFGLTRQLLAGDWRPPAPPGVFPEAIVAAYQSSEAAAREWPQNPPTRREKLTLGIAHRFLHPNSAKGTDLDRLRASVALAADDDFKKKRARMYRWQDDILRSGVPDAQALEEMAEYVSEYNAIVQKASTTVTAKFCFTLVPLAAAALGGPLTLGAAVGNIANLVRFWIFDRKPSIAAHDAEPAAMFHTIEQRLRWKVLEGRDS
jgi:hypothetical protein